LLPAWEAAFHDLHRQVDDMFEELIFRPWAITGRAGWQPALDLYETPDGYRVEIDLPGVAPKDMQILAGEQSLAITGQRQAVPPEQVLSQRCERRCGTFQRVLSFPQAIDPGQVRAEYRRGTVRLYLPRKQAPEGPAQPTARGEEEPISIKIEIP
jgi:HSP20 family protein